MRCDWACVSQGGVWHAFARFTPNEGAYGDSVKLTVPLTETTQLLMSLCGRGPGLHPYSGIRLAPACKRCAFLSKDEGIFTVVA